MKPILLATDGSPTAKQATTFAIELARATGWPLHALCAWAMPATYWSVSSTVLHEAACPVLVVRADVETVAEIPAPATTA